VPDHFAGLLNAPTFGTGCWPDPFTYVGGAFFYATAPPVITVTAQTFASSTTTLYNGAWMRITNTSITPATQAARYSRFDALGGGTTPALDTTGLPATTADPVIAITNGVGTLTFNHGAGLLFTRTTPVAPFNADISLAVNVIDADNVAYESPPGTSANPASFGAATAGNGIAFTAGNSKAMRFGRLWLGNALGSELLALPIPIQTQYWNGTDFVTNTLDNNCTTINAWNIKLSNYQGGITSSNMPQANVSISGNFSAGVGNLKLTKPTSSANGSVDLCVDLDWSAGVGDTTCQGTAPYKAASFLQGAWAGTTYTYDPKSRASFGFYSQGTSTQKSPNVYQRENF